MLALRLAVLAAVTVAMSLGAAMPARADASSTAGLTDTRLLVGFRAGASADERLRVVQSVGGYVDAEIPQLGVTRIVVPVSDALGESADPLDVISGHAAVEWAEEDQTVRLSFTPNDEYYVTHPAVASGQWGIRKALVDRAWDTARGKSTVTVAILDTGVDPTHPDLAGALAPGTTFVSTPDKEKCTPGTTRDDNSHGTHVAGIVGASGDNGQGIAGVAFGVRIMAVKVLDCTGQGNLMDVASGLTWAVDNGARVVNISLGSMSDSSTLRRAVAYAEERGVLVVAAAGNCGTSSDECLTLNELAYPAAYASVLAVGATDQDDTIAFFSTRNDSVDVSAPGRHIVSTTPTYATFRSERATNPSTLRYSVESGTSQASPFVAGIAALIWSAEPSITLAQVRERIRSTAQDLGVAGYDESFGAGRVNAERALAQSGEAYGVEYDTSALPNAARADQPFAASIGITNRSSFTWRSANPNAVRLEWSWRNAAGQPVPDLGGVMPLPADLAAGASATLTGPITAPTAVVSFQPEIGPTTYTLWLELVRDGVATFTEKGVTPATVPVAVGTGFGASYVPVAQAATFDAGTAGTIEVQLTNTGTVAWPAGGDNPVRLSYHWLRDGQMVVWDGVRTALPADVQPGASVTLPLAVLPPDRAGTYTLRIDLVHEGIGWFSGLRVPAAEVTAGVRSAYVATYVPGTLPVILPGGRATLPVTVTNTGAAAWSAAGPTPVRIAAHITDAAGNVVIWDGARTLLAQDLAPGASLATEVIVDAPPAAGSYRARVDVVREGVAWLSGLGVATADVELLVAADYRAELPTGPLTVSVAAPTVSVPIRNIGIATWTVSVVSPLNVSLHWYDAGGNVLIWDGPRTPLPASVAPGETVTLEIDLGTVPADAASVQIDLVSEGIRWFGAGLVRPVTLGP